MLKVIMGIGLPGTGKTTALKSFAEKNSYNYICPDDIRFELLGDASDQTKNREVWQEAYKRLEGFLKNGETVVFDATFVKDLDRKRFIEFVRGLGVEKIQGIVTEVPLDIAYERNRSRERKVPDYAMERMAKSFKELPPEISEGFDSLFYINEFQELVRVEVENELDVAKKEFKIK
jgi:predicted kinase